MCGQLPAPIVNGGRNSFWKWPDFQLWRARDLYLGSGHTTYHRESLIDLYLHTKFHWNRRTVLWTDWRIRKRTFEAGFIRPTLSKHPPKSPNDYMTIIILQHYLCVSRGSTTMALGSSRFVLIRVFLISGATLSPRGTARTSMRLLPVSVQ